MTYESTITYTDGDGKSKRESYVLNAMSTFTEVEAKLSEEFGTYYREFDVTAIKRSKIAEIANTRTFDDEGLWIAELMYIFHDDGTDTEKPIKYKILFYSKSFDSAKAFISEYSQQGYDMSLVSLKLTAFKDVI
jgi:hypothetical protein